ncbi:shikimate kinase [bacterium A37T11]|nr:shikimate kinase [bacterium A37T11]
MPEIEVKPVFLIGFMGSGKSTLGKRLSKQTGRGFIDLDEQIVQTAGMSIPAYFERYGEEKFRELERDCLQTLPLTEFPIVAAGGGTPCFFDNVDWMNGHGTTVYLKLSPTALLRRLMQGNLAARPLLSGKTEEQLLEFIRQKLREREIWYSKADNIIDATGLTAGKLLDYLHYVNK